MMYKDIERLLSIIKCGSFAKAADELYVSRSALTQQIKQLEKELGFVIFSRNHKGVCLTKEGAYYIEKIQSLNKDYEKTISQCCKNQQTGKEHIVIGMMPNLKSPFLPAICKEFFQLHPDVDIQFKEYFIDDFIQKFRAGDFDISAEYFFNYVHDIKGLQAKKVATTSHSLQVVPNHPLAQKNTIRFEDLRGHKLIMYRRGITKSEDELRNYLLQHEPEITIIDIDSYESSLFIKCELEDAVLLAYSLYEDSFSQFVHIPAAWDIPINIGYYCHKNCRPIINEFIQVAARMFEDSNNN